MKTVVYENTEKYIKLKKDNTIMEMQGNFEKRLEKIERAIIEIQNKIIDTDSIINEEERKMLNESVKHEKEGKLVSLEAIKNVRNKAG